MTPRSREGKGVVYYPPEFAKHASEERRGRWVDLAVKRAAREAYAGIALGLMIVSAACAARYIVGAPWWFAMSFACVVAAVAWAGCVRGTR